MVRRALGASFMGGARVFPGGAVDAVDSGPIAASAVRWSGDNDQSGRGEQQRCVSSPRGQGSSSEPDNSHGEELRTGPVSRLARCLGRP